MKFFMKSCFVILVFLWAVPALSQNQPLTPGFDKEEYKEMLRMASSVADTPWIKRKNIPENFELAYRSPVAGFDNRWDLWISQNKVAAISIRGTIGTQTSWLENFYAAMVPATGTVKISDSNEFHYKLSDNPRAAVHVGWLLATGFLSETILPKIDSCYQAGFRDFYITGHSQGGGISFLITSLLLHMQRDGKLPEDIRFKTYCSAAPKPGNLYYAYDYENLTQNGWGYNVVNSVDWVPETPLSIQTVNDFNAVNPFADINSVFKKQKFATRIAMKHAYKKLDRPSKRTVKNYKKYLGKYVGKMAGRLHPEMEVHDYLNSNCYVRTGNTIVLYAQEDYHIKFPDNPEKIFMHHMTGPYMYLLEKYEER